ncbi:DUF317 domain-containing protein [Streptomyces sp. NPDC087440]|uniref:DUF317 domain-containing protein n=1 Tax=Streptomyces sp. NPDC087440 TaxID=3365790 RepID=UPI003803880D
MASDAPTAHILLSKHPTHSSAVIATLIDPTSADTSLARAILYQYGFVAAAAQTMVLARIDSEESHYASRAARALRGENLRVTITSELQEDIDTEWTWHGHPMHWLDREEIREVSADAQKIHDDIRDGRLIIHAHADDGWTTVAAGTYRDGESIHLHGQNHLRTVSTTYETPREALTEFLRLYKDAVRPGPAPLTSTEKATAAALAEALLLPPALLPAPAPEAAPAYAAHPGNHDDVLDEFLNTHDAWSKWRTWSDLTTHLVHDEQTLRIEREHETTRGDTAWTIAAYESPVSDRTWRLSLSTDTPEPILRTVLATLADNDLGPRPPSEETVRDITSPLLHAGWEHTADEHHRTWEIPGATGLQLNRSTSWHLDADIWTLWGGESIHYPTWTLTASRTTPTEILSALTEKLASDPSLPQLTTPVHFRADHHTRTSQPPAPAHKQGTVLPPSSTVPPPPAPRTHR